MLLSMSLGSERYEHDVRYLVKFVKEEAWADDLLNGCLFMNAAGFYASKEKGQGDDREGAIANTGVFRNIDRPIYCMYSVYLSDVIDDGFDVPMQVIEDFGCSDGFAVVLRFDEFDKALRTLETDGYGLKAGLVSYGCVLKKDAPALFGMGQNIPLFIKRPEYQHQKEYRIVVGKSLTRRTHMRDLDGEMVPFIDEEQPFEAIRYRFPSDLRAFAKKVPMRSIELRDGFCHFDLSDWSER